MCELGKDLTTPPVRLGWPLGHRAGQESVEQIEALLRRLPRQQPVPPEVAAMAQAEEDLLDLVKDVLRPLQAAIATFNVAATTKELRPRHWKALLDQLCRALDAVEQSAPANTVNILPRTVEGAVGELGD